MNKTIEITAMGWNLAKKILEWIPVFACGFLVCLMVCGKHLHTPTNSSQLDTLIIDTSKIIYRAAAAKPEIIVMMVDSSHDCWGSIPPMLIGNDTLSIDSANSCKGIYRNVRIGHTPDTLRIPVSFELSAVSSQLTANSLQPFGAEFSIGIGPALGAFGIIDAEARVWYDHWIVEVRPKRPTASSPSRFLSADSSKKIRM